MQEEEFFKILITCIFMMDTRKQVETPNGVVELVESHSVHHFLSPGPVDMKFCYVYL